MKKEREKEERTKERKEDEQKSREKQVNRDGGIGEPKGMGDNDSDDAIDVMRDSDEPAKVAHLTHIASTDIIVLLGLL